MILQARSQKIYSQKSIGEPAATAPSLTARSRPPRRSGGGGGGGGGGSSSGGGNRRAP